MQYVTYDENGNLTGSFIQDLQPEQANNYIEVSDDVLHNWTSYRANAARDGVELIPPYIPPPPTFQELAAMYLKTVQTLLDTVAVEFGYDSLLAAASYADEPAVPKFQAEGKALRQWRSLVWQACYAMFAQAEAGTIPLPSEAAVLSALPPAPVPSVVDVSVNN